MKPAPALGRDAPAEIAARVRDGGIMKARFSVMDSFALAVLAGAFITIGAPFATLAMSGCDQIVAGEELRASHDDEDQPERERDAA